MSKSISKEIKYDAIPKLHPNYKLSKVTQQFGVETATITASGNTYSVFELPAVAFNLSKSFLTLSYRTPQAATPGEYSCQFMGVLAPIKRLQFYDKNSVMLCDIDNFDNYTRVMLHSDQPLDSLINGSYETPLFRCNDIPGGTVYGVRPGSGDIFLGFNEQAYLSSGVDAAGNNAQPDTPNQTRFKIPLSMFKNTIFALDKDLYFDDISFIRITWNSYLKIGFENDGTAGDPGAPLAANVNITSLAIYLAVETNEKINSALKQIN